MKVVIAHATDFYPTNLSSICYRVMSRAALRAWLTEKQLMGLPSLWSKPFCEHLLFSEASLDCLYSTLSKASSS